MSPGGLVPVSNATLCPTEPKANVTVPPGAIVTALGVNARDGVALIVAVCGDGVGVDVVMSLDDPQAASPKANVAVVMAEIARCIILSASRRMGMYVRL
jgi:hypothetical protein